MNPTLPTTASVTFLVLALAWANGSLALAASNQPLKAKSSAKPLVLHVASEGQDHWSGKLAQPNRTRSDGPWATLGHALEEIRSLRQRTPPEAMPPVTVLLYRGTYALNDPIVLTAADSGTENSPLKLLAAPGEHPVLSGGRRIVNWKETSLNGRAVWAADLPAVRSGDWYFHQLWVDGQRRPRARHPNQGYLAIAATPDQDGDWTKGQARFQYKAGDLAAQPALQDAELIVMSKWIESRVPLQAIQEAERMVSLGKRSVFKMEPGDLYYAENAPAWLDAPGEWYLDRAAGTLYYLPLAGEDPRAREIIAPVLPQVLQMNGQPERGLFVEHVQWEGITFAHTEWYYPDSRSNPNTAIPADPPADPAVGGFSQAAIGVPAAIRGDGVRFVTFSGCRLAHLGGYALDLRRGCRNNRVIGCDISDLGGGGIKIGETAIRESTTEVSGRNEIADCQVHDGGRIFHSAIGIWIGQSPGNQIVHCHIHDFYYTGISIGWTWGYGRAIATNNLVEGNYVHHIGRRADGDGPIMSDMAGIYTLGLQRGTEIRNNLWHDMAATRYGGWGIYFDEGTTGILAENNVVYRTTHGGFHQHYGKENTVRNNIFAYGRDHQIQRSRAENHLSFTFRQNIVYWDNDSPLFSGEWSDQQIALDQNIYWRATGAVGKFGKRTLQEWQGSGLDRASLVADPLLADPAHGDFTLNPDSPALGLGFKPIDLRGVGVRAPKARY